MALQYLKNMTKEKNSNICHIFSAAKNSEFTNKIKADPIEFKNKVEPKDEVMNVELQNGLCMIETMKFCSEIEDNSKTSEFAKGIEVKGHSQTTFTRRGG